MLELQDQACEKPGTQIMDSSYFEEGREKIDRSFAIFQDLVTQANICLEKGRYNAAAGYAKVAANYAWHNHSGVFASPQLEQILLQIGQRITPTPFYRESTAPRIGTPKHVLHVLTQAYNTGGHTRLAWRWIQQDKERSHSIVLTSQSLLSTPKPLRDAARGSGGKVYRLDTKIGGLLSRAKALRELAAFADQVVLHIHPHDVIPIMAFSDKQNSPPVIFMNHADHVFWIGGSISDAIAHVRETALLISCERRGIERSRCMILPLPLNYLPRTLSKSQAKRQLGLSEDTVVLLSIGSAYKYRSLNTIPFVDVHVPILKKYKKAALLVIGPTEDGQWVAANQMTEGRIRALGERKDVAVFYQASDIYVDSFPFSGITALLEAGSYEMPSVGYYTSPESQMFRPDDPALKNNLVSAASTEQYEANLSHLIEDENYRSDLGERTKRSIIDAHTGKGWDRFLRDLYCHAATNPPAIRLQNNTSQKRVGAYDVALRHYHSKAGVAYWLDAWIEAHISPLPLGLRAWVWSCAVRLNRALVLSSLLCNWLSTYIRRRLLGR